MPCSTCFLCAQIVLSGIMMYKVITLVAAFATVSMAVPVGRVTSESSDACGRNEEFNGRECVCLRGFVTERTGRDSTACVAETPPRRGGRSDPPERCGRNEVAKRGGGCECASGYVPTGRGGACEACGRNEVVETVSGSEVCVCSRGFKKYTNDRGAETPCKEVPSCGRNEEDIMGVCECVRGSKRYDRGGACVVEPECTRNQIDVKGTCECKAGMEPETRGSNVCVPGGTCEDNARWTDAWGDACDWYAKNDPGGCPTWSSKPSGVELLKECPESCGQCSGPPPRRR